ncbi:hypothetical protein CCS92_34250 [Methylobacterium radiotolerans]|nr:hypothetical protein CCS92_34250 [Methylobacterium radiotolerans]
MLISHSQSGIYPFQTAALDRTGLRAIVEIEPADCPDPAKDDLAPYKDLPHRVDRKSTGVNSRQASNSRMQSPVRHK